MRQVTVTEKYRAVNEGQMDKQEFVRQMRLAFPSLINQFNGYDDSVSILRTKGLLFEEKTMKHDVSDESIRRALDVEITVLGQDPVTCTDSDVIDKARAKAVANLSKDPLHYYNLLSNESSKVDKNDQPKETKRGALEKDTFNDMKKATLKERKENLVEGTRALVGYLAGDTLTTAYNHYDGYPSNLGKGLETHYNDDEKAKDIAMKGYITYLDPETGETESTHKDPAQKIKLPSEDEDMAREIADAINSMGADFGYIWDDRSNRWITIKNTGTRSMIDQISSKLGDYADVQEVGLDDIEEIDTSLDPLEDKKEIIKQVIQLIKSSMPADNETIKSFIKTHYNDIINLGDDEAILDEFQEFLSVNTDYVDEAEPLDTTAAYDNDEETQDMIDKMRRDGKDSEDFVDEAGKETNFDPKEIKSVSFPNGLSVTVGEPHPEEEGIVNFIRKGQNGYEIGFVDGSEGGSYSVDFNGEFLDEDDYIEEKKGTDHDKDGDIDGDDYKHAKDKAIKKAMGKDVNEEHKPKKLKKLTVGGKTYEKGDHDPNDDGRIMSIEKYPNGYFITGQDGEEGYGYAIDLKGNEMDEEDLEGMYEGKKSNINEAVKNIITKVLEEQNINEAATNDLAKIAAEYGDFEGLKPAVIALENVVTEIESFYDKTRSKIQKIYNDLGEIRNEEGLKVGAFIAPSIENAFKRDLRPIIKNQFHGGLDMPKVKRISQDDIDRGYTQMESPKETVFTPVNEKK